MKRTNPSVWLGVIACVLSLIALAPNASGQAVTASLAGKILDTSGGTVAKANVTIANPATGLSRSVQSSGTGDYLLPALPAGDYTVSVELAGFQKQTRSLTLQVGQTATLDFTLAPGRVEEKMVVEANAEVAEPTRTQVSTVITERQIVNLPVNGREFIDFALLAPAVQIGDTTSGSTDVIGHKAFFCRTKHSLQLHRRGRRRRHFHRLRNSAGNAAAGIGAGIPRHQ